MSLIEEIKSAFPTDGPHERLSALVSAIWGKSSSNKVDMVRSWPDLIESAFDEVGDDGIGPLLMFMSPGTFVHFLPAWMTISLLDPPRLGGVREAAIGCLLPDFDFNEAPETGFSRKVDLLTRRQREIAALFLQEAKNRGWVRDQAGLSSLDAAIAFWRESAR